MIPHPPTHDYLQKGSDGKLLGYSFEKESTKRGTERELHYEERSQMIKIIHRARMRARVRALERARESTRERARERACKRARERESV